MFPNVDNGRFHVDEDGTLVIESVRRSDAGEYSCHALSQAGSVETSITIDVRGTDRFNVQRFYTRIRQGTALDAHVPRYLRQRYQAYRVARMISAL